MYLSQRWQTMLGLAPEAMTAAPRTGSAACTPTISVHSGPPLRALRSPVRPLSSHEHRVRHGDGGYRWMLCPAVAVIDRDGRAVRMADR